MLRVLHLLCVLGLLMHLRPVECDEYEYDYENEINDIYRKDSSNELRQSTRKASFNCQEEGFHHDPSDCQTFYRCVDWGNGMPLTPFKFECGTGTVFSMKKGNVCVHPKDSGRPECCEPDFQMNEPGGVGGDDEWDQDAEPPLKPYPSYPLQPQSPSQSPQMPTYPPQRPQSPNAELYPPQRPQQPDIPSPGPPNYPTQSSQRPSQSTQPSLPPQRPTQPSLPSQSYEGNKRPFQPSLPQKPGNQGSQRPENPSVGCNGSGGGGAGSTGGCASSSGCSDEGFFPNPEDCHQFYRCVAEEDRLQRYDFTCGTGTAWDQSLQTCNYEYSVADCGVSSNSASHQGTGQSGYPQKPSYPPQSPTYLPASPSYPSSRPPQSSDRPSFAPGRPSSSLPPTQRPMQEIYPSSERPSTTLYPPSQSSISSSSTKGPVYIPPQQPSTSRPMYPGSSASSAIPGDRNPQSNSGGSKPSGQGSSIPPGAPGTGGRPCSPGSPDDCKEEGFYPNPQDCHKFYRCVNEGESFSRYDFECGPGTAWDQALLTCNYENSVNSCGGIGNQPPQSGSVTGPEDYPGSAAAAANQKPGFGNGPGGYPGSNNNIENQTPSVEIGPGGYPGQRPGRPTTPRPGPSSTVPYQSTNYPTQQSTKQPGSRPSQTQRPTNVSPTDGPTQSPTQESISSPSTTKPSGGSQQLKPSSSNNIACQEEGFFPNPNNCRKFYRCVNFGSSYTKFDFDCGPGTAWDQNLLTCNYIHQVESCGQQQNEIEPDRPSNENQYPSVTSSSSNDNGYPSGESSSNYPSNPSSTLRPTKDPATRPSAGPENGSKPDCNTPKNNTIVCNEAGFNPHPTRCDKFYRCVDNGKGFNVYHFDCPPGTIFDPSIDVCNYPESVYPARDCQMSDGSPDSSQIPSASSPPSVSTTETPNISTVSPTESTTGEFSEMSTTEASLMESTTAGGSQTTESSSDGTTPRPEGTTINVEIMTPEGSTPSESTTLKEMSTLSSAEGTTMRNTDTTINSMQSTTPAYSDKTTTSTDELQSTTGRPSQEMTTVSATTESQDLATQASSTDKPSMENCPAPANLTDEQLVLVCPTGFRRHPKLCNLFYQCTMSGSMEVKILLLQCPNSTIFDEKENKCLSEAESSMPCMGAIADKRIQRRRSSGKPLALVEVSDKQLCPEEGHFPYKNGCSNVFYKCERDSRYELEGYLYKCPKDFVYWSVSRRCERASRLPMCTGMSNESEEENNVWEERWEIPIEERNRSARSPYNI